MVQYRRNFVPGGTFFFTLTLRDRRHTLLTAHSDELRDAMRATNALNPWTTDAIVVLPDHMHMIWTMPDGDSGYAQRIRMLKARFTSTLRDTGRWTATESPWQARYWEHTIRDDHDLENHVAYVHYNPVKHGFAKAVADWPHSSFHRYVRDELVPVDWAGGSDVDVGER